MHIRMQSLTIDDCGIGAQGFVVIAEFMLAPETRLSALSIRNEAATPLGADALFQASGLVWCDRLMRFH